MHGPALSGAALLAATTAAAVIAVVACSIGASTRPVRQLIYRLTGLRERVARLQHVERIAGIGEYVWNADTGALWWSAACYRMFGLEPGSSIDLGRALALIHPDDRASALAAVDALLAGERPPELALRVRRSDGAVRRILTTGELTLASGGRRVIGFMKDVTEIESVRLQLRAAETQYRALFDDNPVPMWIFDLDDCTVLAANGATARLFGYEPGQLDGKALDCVVPADEASPRSPSCRSDTWRDGAVVTCQAREGRRMRLSLAVRDTQFEGHVARLVAAQEVTERERVEERFALIARATSDAVYDFDLESGTLWWSDSFYAMFGYAPGSIELSLAGWAALVHPEDIDRVYASLEEALAGAAEWEETYRLLRRDGGYAHVAERGLISRGAKGQALRMVGGLVDETERRRQEAGLRLLRRAVESADNGVLIADARGVDLPLVYANPAFERMTGYTLAEVRGKNCRILQRSDRDQPGLEAIREGLRSSHEARGLLRNYRKDGTLFWNEVYIAPVRDERGALTHFVGILNDVSERHQFEEQLAHRATHDELTGLPNRVLLEDRLQQALHLSDRFDTGTAVVFVDLDDFKLVNDNLGHAMGDTLLREVARRLQGAVRDTDTVSRFGGDEFIAILSAPHRDDRPSDIVARMQQALAEPITLGDLQHTVTASIGYCCYPAHGTDTHTLLRHADLAMYQAKLGGRNRAVEFRSEYDVNASQRLQLVQRLREALDNDEFTVLFQPQFDCDGRAICVEALVRWQDPQRGLLLPAEFIDACEDSGLIMQLGRQVLNAAASHHEHLVAAGLPQMRIAVNVSAAQFTDELYDDVEDVVLRLGLPPGALELELTESVVMQSPERAIDLMKRIATLGVCFSIDDFGTGYSSLAYLKRFPIDRLKIDRSFVQDLDSNVQDAAICRSIIELARSLDVGTVAEGVETVQQERWLREHGCVGLQGFLLGRPQPFATLLPSLLAGYAVAPIE
ncbi:sensor domain-containing protein [Cognatilysobacter lacus]|uniref:EAL domain-containing protein n=1 Tax=Cognatilysobacter lacus TaxID=1643323 RepID=A0A5D8Z822_9GAMM|nr:EAL domain-containing protein [Lysobacter lacus]TZF90969.1 EAL domain-containing protein [Lysobacter lacus]